MSYMARIPLRLAELRGERRVQQPTYHSRLVQPFDLVCRAVMVEANRKADWENRDVNVRFISQTGLGWRLAPPHQLEARHY